MNKSEQIGELATALVKAQATMRHATKDATNPFFQSKYADFASVWDACRTALNANGLAVSQLTGYEGDDIFVETIMLHTSGQWLSGRLKLTPVKKDPQAIGSAITYARRYALSGICCLATEEDDDGNAATKPMKEEVKQPAPVEQAAPAEDPNFINAAQRKMFFAASKGAGLADDQIKRMMMQICGIDSTHKMTPKMLEDLLAIVRDPVALGAMLLNWGKEDFGG